MSKKRLKYGTGKGRARQAGERHPSGELKRSGPSQQLVERRRELCPNPDLSSNPLDCAYGNGWLTEKDHRTGRQYAGIYRACGFSIGSTSASAGQEVDVGSELTKLSLSQMSDTAITAAWDAVMARPLKLGIEHDGALLEKWNRVNRNLNAAQRQQVYLVCVMDSWPQWLVQRIAGKTMRARLEVQAKAERRGLTEDELASILAKSSTHWERSRDNLIKGLAAVRAALQPKSIQSVPEPIEATPAPRTRKRAESTVYVDETGKLIREVVRMVPIDTTS